MYQSDDMGDLDRHCGGWAAPTQRVDDPAGRPAALVAATTGNPAPSSLPDCPLARGWLSGRSSFRPSPSSFQSGALAGAEPVDQHRLLAGLADARGAGESQISKRRAMGVPVSREQRQHVRRCRPARARDSPMPRRQPGLARTFRRPDEFA